MKKYALFIAIVFIFSAPLARAQEASSYNPTLLPTSQFYFLKEWWRDIQLFVTRDPVKKAGLELDILDQKAAEAEKIFETEPQNLSALNKAAGNYASAKAKVEAKLETLKNSSQSAEVQDFINKGESDIQNYAQAFQTLGDKILQSRSGKIDNEAINPQTDN